MASRQEFRRVDNIISTVKRMGNEANIFDVLDETKTSLSWWKDHKAWIFHRFPQLSLVKMEGNKYLVYKEEEPLPNE